MRIALVASLVSPLRPAEANGPHAVIVDLARGLAAHGHTVTVYAAAGSVADDVHIVEIPVEAEAQRANVRVDHAALAEATAALKRGFARLFGRLRQDAPDVVSQHAFDAVAIELAEGMRVLHTLHLPPMVDDVVAAARVTRASLATVSEAARASWQRAGVEELSVIRNGVPSRELARGVPVAVALIAGRIAPEKGTDAAIRVARRAGLAVMVAGDAYDKNYFGDVVEPLLRPGEWIGSVPREELFQLMARCAVTLMPVRWDEPFGLVGCRRGADGRLPGGRVPAWRSSGGRP